MRVGQVVTRYHIGLQLVGGTLYNTAVERIGCVLTETHRTAMLLLLQLLLMLHWEPATALVVELLEDLVAIDDNC